jgi:RimJ/RimL family protein N-acetyltransferase
MINARDLMRLHLETLFTRDDAGRFIAVNEPGGAPAPRFFMGRTAAGNIWGFRQDVDAALVNDLRALCESQPTSLDVEAELGGAAPFIACLSRAEPVRKTWAGPAFRFPSDLAEHETAVLVTSENAAVLSPYLEEWRGNVSPSAPMVVALEGRKAVSVCCSVRVTSQAHEAGVETHPDFRGRGHATRAVSGWANAIRERDRIPLYSTSWENESSRALAKKLGLIQYGVDLHIA